MLLEYLVRNAGRVVTRAMLLGDVWKMRVDASTNIVECIFTDCGARSTRRLSGR
jgi:DNA-binding response OmpR family regulator